MEYEAGKVIGAFIFQYVRSQQFNPLAPFANAYEYKLARFFHESKTSLKDINKFFKNDLLPAGLPKGASVRFKSGHTWREMMRELVDQPEWHKGTVDFHLQEGCVFYYRDLKSTIRYLLRQRTFADHLVYEPVREFDVDGNQVYTDIHTGDWWWRTQVWLQVPISPVYKLTWYSLSPLDDSSGWLYPYSSSSNIRSNMPHQFLCG